eukprot:scaffold1626_cov372-Prasinococcus_capsulatus_cf.AAC.11
MANDRRCWNGRVIVDTLTGCQQSLPVYPAAVRKAAALTTKAAQHCNLHPPLHHTQRRASLWGILSGPRTTIRNATLPNEMPTTSPVLSSQHSSLNQAQEAPRSATALGPTLPLHCHSWWTTLCSEQHMNS